MAILGCDGQATARLYLFMSVRGWLSAAVRLGIIGPHEAQRMQASLSPQIAECSLAGWNLSADLAAQTTPLLDILQAGHDRLYSKLFQS